MRPIVEAVLAFYLLGVLPDVAAHTSPPPTIFFKVISFAPKSTSVASVFDTELRALACSIKHGFAMHPNGRIFLYPRPTDAGIYEAELVSARMEKIEEILVDAGISPTVIVRADPHKGFRRQIDSNISDGRFEVELFVQFFRDIKQLDAKKCHPFRQKMTTDSLEQIEGALMREGMVPGFPYAQVLSWALEDKRYDVLNRLLSYPEIITRLTPDERGQITVQALKISSIEPFRILVDRAIPIGARIEYHSSVLAAALCNRDIDSVVEQQVSLIVAKKLTLGVDVGADRNGLLCAVWQKHRPMIERLVGMGFSLNSSANLRPGVPIVLNDGYTKDFLEFLKSKGAILNHIDVTGSTLLHYFAPKDVDTLKWLQSQGVDVLTVNNSGQTALHYATLRDAPAAVIEAMIQAGANPNAKTRDGYTALTHAVTRGNVAVAAILLKSGAQVRHVTPPWIALPPLAGNKAPELLHLLAQYGADFNELDRSGSALLHHACRNLWLDAAEKALLLGADPNVLSGGRATPLHSLVAPRAKVPTSKPLTRQERNSQFKLAKLLIDAGADRSIRDGIGKMPYEYLSQMDSDAATLFELLKPR
jgi:ankyrin repeat protein